MTGIGLSLPHKAKHNDYVNYNSKGIKGEKNYIVYSIFFKFLVYTGKLNKLIQHNTEKPTYTCLEPQRSRTKKRFQYHFYQSPMQSENLFSSIFDEELSSLYISTSMSGGLTSTMRNLFNF